MNPKPLDSLNHLTVPVAIDVSYRKKLNVRALTPPVQNPTLLQAPMFGLQARVRHNRYRRKLEPKHRADHTPFPDSQPGFLRGTARATGRSWGAGQSA